ncbi:Xylooligosaccharide oxidase-like protein [Cladobotryum mycophilum]|uniref:Xylooligosaccharide oxidase-like protein n=1 Tax=Cladobotryum mycophilum TaxID=491253 RepID=A0ABR0SCE4_9HYPO
MRPQWKSLAISGFCVLSWIGSVKAADEFIACLQNIKSNEHSNLTIPTSSTYDTERLGYNLAVHYYPRAIYYPETTENAADAVKCAVFHHVTITPRSGGHSYEGYSAGGMNDTFVIDVSRMAHFRFIKEYNYAVVGAGHRLGPLYAKLWREGQYLISAGTCPTMGIAGHILSGGLGMVSRKYGVASDGVVNMTVIDANGDIKLVNSKSNAELFWALRGAGSGSFALVTEFYIRAYEAAPKVTTMALDFPLEQYSKVIDDFSKWSTLTYGSLTAQMVLHSQGISLLVTVLGPKENAWRYVDVFLKLTGNDKSKVPHHVHEGTWHDAASRWANLSSGSLEHPVTDDPRHFRGTSLLYQKPLSKREKDIIRKYALHKPERSSSHYVTIDMWGGKISTTGFPSAFDNHRAVHLGVQYMVKWGDRNSNLNLSCEACLAWAYNFRKELSKVNSARIVESYQGYMVRNEKDPLLDEYYGDSMLPLKQVKKMYDPYDRFKFPQSIPLP